MVDQGRLTTCASVSCIFCTSLSPPTDRGKGCVWPLKIRHQPIIYHVACMCLLHTYDHQPSAASCGLHGGRAWLPFMILAPLCLNTSVLYPAKKELSAIGRHNPLKRSNAFISFLNLMSKRPARRKVAAGCLFACTHRSAVCGSTADYFSLAHQLGSILSTLGFYELCALIVEEPKRRRHLIELSSSSSIEKRSERSRIIHGLTVSATRPDCDGSLVSCS